MRLAVVVALVVGVVEGAADEGGGAVDVCVVVVEVHLQKRERERERCK
jgi:hypothetical protein